MTIRKGFPEDGYICALGRWVTGSKTTLQESMLPAKKQLLIHQGTTCSMYTEKHSACQGTEHSIQNVAFPMPGNCQLQRKQCVTQRHNISHTGISTIPTEINTLHTGQRMCYLGNSMLYTQRRKCSQTFGKHLRNTIVQKEQRGLGMATFPIITSFFAFLQQFLSTLEPGKLGRISTISVSKGSCELTAMISLLLS